MKFINAPQDLLMLVIEGPRVQLVAIDESWAEDIFRNFTPEIARFMVPKPAENIEETIEFVHKSIQEAMSFRVYQAVVRLKLTGEFLGCCGLHIREDERIPELGVWIKKSAHGNRYGREAVLLLKEWADKNIEYDYLVYPVDRSNISSRKIPETLGGYIVEEKLFNTMWGGTLDEVVYRIDKPGK